MSLMQTPRGWAGDVYQYWFEAEKAKLLWEKWLLCGLKLGPQSLLQHEFC